MKKGFAKIHCRDILYPAVVTTYLATVIEHKGMKVAVHSEFDAWTVRWFNKAELDSKRQWERVSVDGMNWMMLPEKTVAVSLGEELLRELDGGEGGCLEVAVRRVVREWDTVTELGDWDKWRVDERERWMRKYGRE